MQIFRVGTYKSFVEPYTRSDMSPEDREATKITWMPHGRLIRPTSMPPAPKPPEARPLRERSTPSPARRIRWRRRQHGPHSRFGGWRSRPPTNGANTSSEKLGAGDEGKGYKHVDLAPTWIADARGGAPRPTRSAWSSPRAAIVDGEQPSGVIGGDTVARLIRQAREDNAIKAVVLRVDSPGGSATASEVIRRELELTRQAGKPVIVSMGSVAASGGYWISMAADEVWAGPSTITGSIGIFAMLPDLSGPMNKLGLTVDGVGTTPLSGGLDPRRPLDPQVASVLQQSIEFGYKRFI
jgi:protease-4